MYSMIIQDRILYLIFTGPGVRDDVSAPNMVSGMAANAVVRRGIQKIEKVEKEIDKGRVQELVAERKYSFAIPLHEIQDIKTKGGIYGSLKFRTPERKFKFQFEYNTEDQREAFVSMLQAR